MELAVVPLMFVSLLVTGSLALVATRFPSHAQLLTASLVAHLVSALVNLWLILEVYGFGDVLMYHSYGADLADAMRMNFGKVFPEVVRVFLQQENRLSVYVPAEGSDVASMVALTGVANLFLGNNLLAVSLAFATASFLGKVTLLRAFLETIPKRLHTYVVVGTMLVPSSVFWASGIIKEAVVLPAIGFYLLGLIRVVDMRPRGIVPLVAGALLVGLIKPFLLLVLVAATGAYVYSRRSFRQGRIVIRPIPLLLGATIAIAGVLLIGEVFERFSINALAEEAARYQATSLKGQGGSTYSIGSSEDRTLTAQLAYVPYALVTGWFRPFLFEASNPQMAINGLETLAFLGTFLYALRLGPTTPMRVLLRHPILMFCLSFAIVCGIATGLTSANLGTLSRYRMPLIPFLSVTLIMLVEGRGWQPAPARARSRMRVGPRPVPAGH